MLDGASLYDQLLTPTRIYVKSVLALLRELPVHAIAHITGGGLTRQHPARAAGRARGRDRCAPLAATGDVRLAADAPATSRDAEMYRTFNCGIGMTVCVASDDADRARAILADARRRRPRVIGEVASGDRGVVIAG